MAPTATVYVENGSKLQGIGILNSALTYPTYNSTGAGDTAGAFDMTARQLQTQIDAFSGTAVTLTGDDAAVESCLIIGFDRAVFTAATYYYGRGALMG